MPKLLERCSAINGVKVSRFHTVLVEGDDMADPVVMPPDSLLDGHNGLSRDLAQRGHFPGLRINAASGLRGISRRLRTKAATMTVESLARKSKNRARPRSRWGI